MADTQIGNWRRWQKYLVSHPLVVGFSLRPHPWLNSDGTFDFDRMCIPVFLGRKLSDEETERYNLPRLIEEYPVQYHHPDMLLRGKPFALPGDSGSLICSRDGTPIGLLIAILGKFTFASTAHNIEELLEVSFTPPISWQGHPQYDSTKIPKDPCERFDVLVSGISVGHRLVPAGTLGAFVWDKKTGQILGLTCAHVAAPPGAKIGDVIYQPGPLDIRTRFGRNLPSRISADISYAGTNYPPPRQIKLMLLSLDSQDLHGLITYSGGEGESSKDPMEQYKSMMGFPGGHPWFAGHYCTI